MKLPIIKAVLPLTLTFMAYTGHLDVCICVIVFILWAQASGRYTCFLINGPDWPSAVYMKEPLMRAWSTELS